MKLASLLLVLAASVAKCHGNNCILKINDKELSANAQPLLLQIDATNNMYSSLYLPDNDGHIKVPEATDVRVACIGAGNSFKNIRPEGSVQYAQATCSVNGVFQVWPDVGMLQFRDFNQLYCAKHPEPTSQHTNVPCSQTGKLILIGFKDKLQTYHIMTICFDAVNRHTLWSQYNLVEGIKGKATAARPSWTDSDSCANNNNPTSSYTKAEQMVALDGILGADRGKLYISTSGNYYLAKGHLTEMAAFVYGSQQRATCDYINAAPQWQTMNNGNWKVLESRIREMAALTRRNFEVYTGTHGITKLEGKPLYLTGRIPVPAVFWKVVYWMEQHEAVLFITVNNPHLQMTEIDPSYWNCSDVCNNLPWLSRRGRTDSWEPNNKVKGYSICCQLNKIPRDHALRGVIQTLPDNIAGATLLT